ncbi:hypothetical protein SDC9_108287 [bioreactor metagenome]|uniref:Uncharacterized protein n=1 Tax=bioreactor metagenome TaxID=1076179 RepID=A0A645B7H9_9ZZZZ
MGVSGDETHHRTDGRDRCPKRSGNDEHGDQEESCRHRSRQDSALIVHVGLHWRGGGHGCSESLMMIEGLLGWTLIVNLLTVCAHTSSKSSH